MEMLPIQQRVAGEVERIRRSMSELSFDIRVSIPGIIESFDPIQQTVNVRVALREKISLSGDVRWEEIPILPDVPIFMPRAGGYLLTLPIKPGDECWVVFADGCIDAWWQSGGVQNQIDRRRHDLSDGCAFIGPWSQPNRVTNYSTSSAQLRNESGSAFVEIEGDNIKIKGDKVNIECNDFTSDSKTFTKNNSEDTTNTGAFVMNSSGISQMNGSGNTSIDGRRFLSHTHNGVESGPSNTGGVN